MHAALFISLFSGIALAVPRPAPQFSGWPFSEIDVAKINSMTTYEDYTTTCNKNTDKFISFDEGSQTLLDGKIHKACEAMPGYSLDAYYDMPGSASSMQDMTIKTRSPKKS